MVQVKIKEHSHKPHACSRFASLIQTFAMLLVPHNVAHLFHFVCFTNFSTARVSVSCLNTYTFPTHNPIIPAYFYLRIIYPIKPCGRQSLSLFSALFQAPSCYWNENNFRRPPGASYFPFQQHIIIMRNLAFPFTEKGSVSNFSGFRSAFNRYSVKQFLFDAEIITQLYFRYLICWYSVF